LKPREFGVRRRGCAERLDEDVGEARQQEPELVCREVVATGAIGEQAPTVVDITALAPGQDSIGAKARVAPQRDSRVGKGAMKALYESADTAQVSLAASMFEGRR